MARIADRTSRISARLMASLRDATDTNSLRTWTLITPPVAIEPFGPARRCSPRTIGRLATAREVVRRKKQRRTPPNAPARRSRAPSSTLLGLAHQRLLLGLRSSGLRSTFERDWGTPQKMAFDAHSKRDDLAEHGRRLALHAEQLIGPGNLVDQFAAIRV